MPSSPIPKKERKLNGKNLRTKSRLKEKGKTMSSVNGINLAISSMNGKWLCREKDYVSTHCCCLSQQKLCLLGNSKKPPVDPFPRYFDIRVMWLQPKKRSVFCQKEFGQSENCCLNFLWPFSFTHFGKSINVIGMGLSVRWMEFLAIFNWIE